MFLSDASCSSPPPLLLLPRLLWHPRRGSVTQLLRKGRNSSNRKTVLIPQEMNIYCTTGQMNCSTWTAGKLPMERCHGKVWTRQNNLKLWELIPPPDISQRNKGLNIN